MQSINTFGSLTAILNIISILSRDKLHLNYQSFVEALSKGK